MTTRQLQPVKTPYLSLDLWDTILRRRCHPDEVKLYTAQRMILLLQAAGRQENLPGPMELLAARQAVEARIGTDLLKKGFDDEYEIEEVLLECLRKLAGKDLSRKQLADMADKLVRAEIEQEKRLTYPDPDLLDFLKNSQYKALYIISDFYMSADKTEQILQSHSLPFTVDRYFISCDCGYNKRSGRLFRHVCSELNIDPASLTHVGDNRSVDVDMAQKNGLSALHFIGDRGERARSRNQDFFNRRRNGSAALLSANAGASQGTGRTEQDKLHAYGRFLAPIFVGFALFIQHIAEIGRHKNVFFFTREGRFFKQVFERVSPHSLFGMQTPDAHLLPVSRLATFFPSLQAIEPEQMMRLWSQYHTQSITSFLGSLGLDPAPFRAICHAREIDPDEMVCRPWEDQNFLTLFNDADFMRLLTNAWQERRTLLKKFLAQQNFGLDGQALTVDIGWRGTIQDNLALLLPETTVTGCYLGLQDFFNQQPENTTKHGYLADHNRGEFHAMLTRVMPFEMLCFGPGGSAVGYRKSTKDKIEARFQIDAEEDQFFENHIRFFQEGVLGAADEICAMIERHGLSLGEVRNEARQLALRYLSDPPAVMCRTFHALKQDDTFGMARTIYPGRKTFRLQDRLLLYFSQKHKEKFFEDLEQSGWPQCLLKMRYRGIFHHTAGLRKRLLPNLGLPGQPLPSALKDLGWTLHDRLVRFNNLNDYPVRAIVTGMEHSGTTILSILLKQHPGLNSGFECGLLLADSPASFQNVHPWYEWMQKPASEFHWGVGPEQMQQIRASKSFTEAYRKLLRYSPVFENWRNQQICDKTPRYLKYLDTVLEKLPDFVPCFVIEKDPQHLWLSHKRRYGDFEKFAENFTEYQEGLRRGLARHGARIHRIKYEVLCMNLKSELERIFRAADLTLEKKFIDSWEDNLKKYYTNIRSQASSLPADERERLGELQERYADVMLPPFEKL